MIKTNIKQNFVKEKITKHECVSFTITAVSNISYLNCFNFLLWKWDFGEYFKLYMVIYAKISMIQNRVLFFLYKKVLRKAG